MWQSQVIIGEATSEIRWLKRIKIAVKHNGRRPALLVSAAITTTVYIFCSVKLARTYIFSMLRLTESPSHELLRIAE